MDTMSKILFCQRPAIIAGRSILALMLALTAAIAATGAAAESGHVEPKSMTPPAATGDVPEPDGYRTNEYRMPVPRTLKGAKVVTPDDAEKLLKENGAVFIDVYPRAPKPDKLPAGTVWRDLPHSSIAGSHWLPNVGYGVLSPEFETYFKTRLETLTAGNKSKPVLFFCLKDCWMSWNAAKRAIAWGYTSVIWFPEGTEGWQAIGNDLTPLNPVP
jgi:PQQ-dependent catabolism-associated CXXCW motif protein